MKTNPNKISLIIINFCCVSLSALIFVRVFLGNDFTVVSESFDIGASDIGGYEETALPVVKSTASDKSDSNKAVAVSSGTVVLGKVLEKYISPYTANTSYKNVYLKNSTDLSIDLKTLLSSKLSFDIEKNSAVQVLIINTHATETFLTEEKDFYTDKDNSRTTDNNLNMVAIGEIVTKRLNKAGIKTVHDKTLHDYPSYNESYSRAANTICSNLKKYPSIKVVIDLHRDSITTEDNDKIKLTKEINGKKAAQIMLVMGSQSGNTKNFPDYKENLKLAVKIQSKLESMYKGLARSVSLMPKNYNESLTKGSVLIEIGTDANTFEEASYSAELLSNALAELFNEL